MRWADEVYVKVYTRDTAEWLALGWEAQSLLLAILRKADRAGIVSLGRTGLRGIAGLTGFPGEVVSRALPLLLDDGCIEETPDALVVRNFLAAQETPASDRARKQAQRARDRDVARQPRSAAVDVPSAPSPPPEELPAAEPVKAAPAPAAPPPSAESSTLALPFADPVEPVNAAPKARTAYSIADAKAIFAVWLEARAAAYPSGSSALRLKDSHCSKIKSLMTKGDRPYTREELCAAAKGMFLDDYRAGTAGLLKFEQVFFDGNVDKFIGLAVDGAPVQQSSKLHERAPSPIVDAPRPKPFAFAG